MSGIAQTFGHEIAAPAMIEALEAEKAAASGPGVSLVGAFAAFSSAAESLERSYMGLGQEVCRLRKELELERDLRRRREALAEISALLAHEIRNPLGSLELFAGLLAGSPLSEQERGWVEQIQSGLRILSATVNNILEYHSQRPLELALTELNEVLDSIVALLVPVADRAGVRCVTQTPREPLWVRADRRRLEQVFLNLSLNAFRFAAQGGVLEIRAVRRGQNTRIAFSDRGPGIAADVLERIFDPGVSTGAGGAGLGLAVVKRIVEQHGGRISINSQPGRGSCFELQFPLAAKNVREEKQGDDNGTR